MTQRDSQNKGTRTSPARLSFVLKVPLRHLRPSVIYSVPWDRILQRAYYYMVGFPLWRVSVMWQNNYSHILLVFYWLGCIPVLPFLACIKGGLMRGREGDERGGGSASAIYKRESRVRDSAKENVQASLSSKSRKVMWIYVLFSFHSFVACTLAASITLDAVWFSVRCIFSFVIEISRRVAVCQTSDHRWS